MIITKQIVDSDHLTDEQKISIAEMIFETDDFIYPSLFAGEGSPFDNAIRMIPYILDKGTDAMFCKNNIFACFDNDQIIGIILWVKGELVWDYEQFLADGQDIGVHLLRKNVEAVSKAYVGERYDSIDANKNEVISLINVCVAKSMRGKGIGSIMLDSFIQQHEENAMEICVLKKNRTAIQLYQKMGFQVTDEYPGFSIDNEKPLCYEMRR